MKAPKVKNINLNIRQEDGGFRIAGLTNPSVAKSHRSPWSEGEGSYVYYGAYPQEREEDGTYRTLPVKWRVLDADTIDFSGDDKERHTMLLWSDKVLDGQIFNENASNDYTGSQVQSWLNGIGEYAGNGFLDTAFSEKERPALVVSYKKGSGKTEDEKDILRRGQYLYKDNSGLSQNETEDRCFLLSAEEMYREAYGFCGGTNSIVRLPDNPANASTMQEMTEYAVSRGVGGVESCCNHMVRSADSKTDIFVGMTSFYGACTRKSHKNMIGVSPACNLDLSQVMFVSSASGEETDSFRATEEPEAKEWRLTMQGGTGFSASALSGLSGETGTCPALEFQVTALGMPRREDIQYDRISAMLVAEDGTVVCFGKVGDAVTGKLSVTVPDSVPRGRYTLKLFAEDVSGENGTNYASDMAEFSIVLNGTVSAGMMSDNVQGFSKVLQGVTRGIKEKTVPFKTPSARAKPPETKPPGAEPPETKPLGAEPPETKPPGAKPSNTKQSRAKPPQMRRNPAGDEKIGDSILPEDEITNAIPLKVMGRNGKIRLSWKRVREAEAYVVYGARGSGKMKRLCTLRGKIGCVMTGLRREKDYRFFVVAVADDEGREKVVGTSETIGMSAAGEGCGVRKRFAC